MTEPSTTQEMAQSPLIAGLANLLTPFSGTEQNVFVEDFFYNNWMTLLEWVIGNLKIK